MRPRADCAPPLSCRKARLMGERANLRPPNVVINRQVAEAGNFLDQEAAIFASAAATTRQVGPIVSLSRARAPNVASL